MCGELIAVFGYAGASHRRALTDAIVNHRVAQARANNTRRNRLARICTFLRWCVRQGERHGRPPGRSPLQNAHLTRVAVPPDREMTRAQGSPRPAPTSYWRGPSGSVGTNED